MIDRSTDRRAVPHAYPKVLVAEVGLVVEAPVVIAAEDLLQHHTEFRVLVLHHEEWLGRWHPVGGMVPCVMSG